MQRFRTFICAVCAVLAAAACSDEEDILPKQQEQIRSYLTGAHSPRLIAAGDIGESLEDEPAFFDQTGNTAYRYIATWYDPNRSSWTRIERGDSVWITLSAYRFTGRRPSESDLYYSNDPAMEAAVRKLGLTGDYWEFGKPLGLRVGYTPLVKGVTRMLPGCCEGDRVEIYMTYTMAYGDRWMYNIEQESPIAWFFTIDKVKR